jgi:hypothetical protein
MPTTQLMILLPKATEWFSGQQPERPIAAGSKGLI